MTDPEALDVACAMEAAGLSPGIIRRELRAQGAPEATADALAPSFSACGIHEHDRPVDRCSRCDAFAIELRAELATSIASEDGLDRARRTRVQRKILRAA